MPKLVAAVIVIVAAIARNGRIGTLPAAQQHEPEDREREQREVLVRSRGATATSPRPSRMPLRKMFWLGAEEVPHAADAQHDDPRHLAQVVLELGGADRAPRDLVRRLVAEEVGVGAGDVAELCLEIGRARFGR